MSMADQIMDKLERVFNHEQANVLTEVIVHSYGDLVKADDFNELKEIVKELGIKVGELAQAQKRTEDELVRFGRHFDMKLGAIGARWGIDSEVSFREGMRYILEDTGIEVKHYDGYDKEGKVFGRPDQVELDIIIKDAMVIVGEIKSSVDMGDVSIFERKVRFYEEDTKSKVTDKVIISPFIDPRGTVSLAQGFNIRLITNPEDVVKINPVP